jgi:hypothetical protein
MAKKFLTGLNLVVLNSDPSTGSEGELYFNSSASVAKIYQAGAWSVLGAGGGGGSTTVSTTEPSSPEIGDSWYKNDTGEFYIYDGTYWVEVNGVISLTQEEVQDYVAPLFTSASGTNVVAIYDDVNNVINLNTSGSLISVDSIVYPDYITFDTTPENSSASTGTIFWDNGDSVLKAILNENVELGIGQESVALVKNDTGSSIPKGSVVYINGAQGQRPTIALSDADMESTSSKTFGFTAENIADEAEGFVITEGILRGVNTNGLTEGGSLWLSSTAGGFTQTIPIQPSHSVFLGYVIKANASSGEIFVKIQNGYELEELHNVLITSASVQQALVYDSDGLWKNEYIVNSINGTGDQIDINNEFGTGDIILSLPNELITPGNLTVTGNLTVSGSTTYINTETLNIEDNIVLLNSNVTGAPTGTAGIEIERGTETNSYMLWDESLQAWNFSNDIKTYAVRSNNILELNVSASVGSSGEIDLLTAFAELNINTDGSIDLRPGDVSGFERYKFTKTHLEFPDLSQQDTAFLGMPSYDTGDLAEGTNLYFTSQRAIDALDSTLSNYLLNSSASTIYLTQSNAASIYLTQANASTTYLTAETDPIFVASDAYNITSASTSAWNAAYGWGDHSSAGYSLTSHNHSLDSLSNVVITGTPTDGQAIVWDTSTSKWVNETVSGGASYPDQTGNDGKFLQTNSGSVSWQNVDFTGYLTESSASSTYLTQASASSTYQTIGSYLTSESDTFETVTDRGATSSNAITISNTTQSTTPTTGALVLSGGLGVAKDVWIDGDLHVNGTTITENTQTVATHDNLIYLNAAQDSVITNAVFSSGSITYTAENNYTAGMDIRITGIDPAGFNISTGDGLVVGSANSTQFVVVKANPGATYVSGGTAHAKEEANPDLGFAGGYYNAGYAHAGLFRDSTDGIFKFFEGYTPEPDEAVNIDTTHASFAFADIQIRNIKPQGSSQNDNFGIGYNAMNSASGFANFAIGQNAFDGGSGTNNFAVGDNSMENNTGERNFAFGASALTDNTGNYNYGIGYNALQNNSGWDNYSIGPALYGNAGDWNYAVGTNSLQSNTGDYNFAFGYQAGLNNTGSYNVYIGKSEGLSTSNNIIIADNEGNLRAQYLSASSGWTLGTVVSGTWNGSAIGYQYGGTGLTTLGTAGQALVVNAGATGLEWATPSGGGGGPTTTTTSITVNTAISIESFAIATSRTAEAIIQITQGTDYYSSKVLLIHDGTNVKITEYAILESTVGAIPVTISSAISGSNVEIRATITDAATTNATAKVVMTEVAV